MKMKFCPKCENTDLVMAAGGEIGLWVCKVCGHESSIFPEKEVRV